MAPRTPEQQKAYNQKRREETAAMAGKPKWVEQYIENEAKVATGGAVNSRRATYLAHEALKKKAKSKGGKKPEPKRFEGKTATAKHIKGVDAPVQQVKRDDIPLKDAQGKTVAVLDTSTISANTIPKSYRRAFSGNGATRRGNMEQLTVTFTIEQFSILRERAEFYNVSLAETVRRCVIAGPLPERA